MSGGKRAPPDAKDPRPARKNAPASPVRARPQKKLQQRDQPDASDNDRASNARVFGITPLPQDRVRCPRRLEQALALWWECQFDALGVVYRLAHHPLDIECRFGCFDFVEAGVGFGMARHK